MGYTPQHEQRNKLGILCPLKHLNQEEFDFCIQEKCAWFMIIQRACAINVLARQQPKKPDF